jgi:hypothetical protein
MTDEDLNQIRVLLREALDAAVQSIADASRGSRSSASDELDDRKGSLLDAAKLAPAFIKKPPRRLADLKVGEEGAIEWLAMKVDAENRCYLNPEAKLREGGRRTPMFVIYATRTEAGFEVSLAKDAVYEWTAGEYVPDDRHRHWFPVVKLSYDDRRELA